MISVQLERGYKAAEKIIRESVIAYNTAKVGYPHRKKFAVTVRDGSTVVGGAICALSRGWLNIEWLWIGESLRGQDYATKVMDMAESHGRELGAKGAYLDTLSFQAKPFYEKRGYVVFGEIEDFPDGHQRFFMKKRL